MDWTVRSLEKAHSAAPRVTLCDIPIFDAQRTRALCALPRQELRPMQQQRRGQQRKAIRRSRRIDGRRRCCCCGWSDRPTMVEEEENSDWLCSWRSPSSSALSSSARTNGNRTNYYYYYYTPANSKEAATATAAAGSYTVYDDAKNADVEPCRKCCLRLLTRNHSRRSKMPSAKANTWGIT